MKWSSFRVTRVTYLVTALLLSNMLEKSGGQFVSTSSAGQAKKQKIRLKK